MDILHRLIHHEPTVFVRCDQCGVLFKGRPGQRHEARDHRGWICTGTGTTD